MVDRALKMASISMNVILRLTNIVFCAPQNLHILHYTHSHTLFWSVLKMGCIVCNKYGAAPNQYSTNKLSMSLFCSFIRLGFFQYLLTHTTHSWYSSSMNISISSNETRKFIFISHTNGFHWIKWTQDKNEQNPNRSESRMNW